MPGPTPAASDSVATRAYLFVDGIHVSVRVGETTRCACWSCSNVREDGVKEVLAVEDGYHESAR